MFIEILKYGFLVIFFATAVIGIASIPDWIKIPEWYRKRIFIALILEVVGVIVIYSNQEFINTESSCTPEIRFSDNNWVALDGNGSLINPEVVVKTQDTIVIKQLGKQDLPVLDNLTVQIIENGLSIRNKENNILALIKASELKQCGLFNAFETAKGEITSSENYAYVKWTKPLNDQWKKKGSFIGPFEMEITDGTDGTYYQIKDNKAKIVFNSKNSSKDLISVDNRIIHFYEYNNIFYLLRIAWADLEQEEKYVHVINVRMVPTLKVQ